MSRPISVLIDGPRRHRVEGAGHEILARDLDAVMAEIEPLLTTT